MDKQIEEKIYRIRGQRVMLDSDLASLYGVKTKVLNRAVKRNIFRFPPDFMFQLNVVETQNLRCQFGTSSLRQQMSSPTSNYGGRRYQPLVFTEQGVAMLSSVLHSRQAVTVNIAIMRAFVKLRHALGVRKDLAAKVEHIEGRLHLVETDVRFLREDLREKEELPGKPPTKIKGFEKE